MNAIDWSIKIPFYIPDKGTNFYKCIRVWIPTECCGIKTDIENSGTDEFQQRPAGVPKYKGYVGKFNYACQKHMATYLLIWKNFADHSSNQIKQGFNCNTCNNLNEYAEANQPDGTYKCYSCREVSL